MYNESGLFRKIDQAMFCVSKISVTQVSSINDQIKVAAWNRRFSNALFSEIAWWCLDLVPTECYSVV